MTMQDTLGFTADLLASPAYEDTLLDGGDYDVLEAALADFDQEQTDVEAESLVDSFARPRPQTLLEAESRVAAERTELAAAAQGLMDELIRFTPKWWDQAVEEVIVADPTRTMEVAASLPDLKIALVQLRVQLPSLVELMIAPLLPDPADDKAIAAFGPLLQGRKPSQVIEPQLRILLGAVASQLHRAGFFGVGGTHSFTASGNVWRYMFGIELGDLHVALSHYDQQILRLQQLFSDRVELLVPMAKAQALALWKSA